mgnify:CR=1 FL=1|jgi:hypothetical protein|tara:strand:- start:446 stop:667 length:222 start_codon:yes stop_codon:yes gene_type:complete
MSSKVELYSSDYVIVNKKTQEPVESLDVVYHYSTVIDLINTGESPLYEGVEFVSMTQLSEELQQRYKTFWEIT